MTTTDWIIDIALVLIVFRQLREEAISKATFLIPIAMITFAAKNYLHSIPTAGNDLALIAMFTSIGVVFGLLGGLLTRVRVKQGRIHIKATAGAAGLWVASMGFRLAFAIWSSHPTGQAHLTSFSADHHITTAQAWVTALILMAFSEVIIRLATIATRAWILNNRNNRLQPQKPANTEVQAPVHDFMLESLSRR